MNERVRYVGIAAAAAAAVLSLTAATAAFAGLASFGPIDEFGYPSYYQDVNGLALELCIPAADPLCVADPLPNPALPPDVATGNFLEEAFYWLATADVGTTAGPLGASLILATESSFLNGVVVDGEQIVFARMRVRMNLDPAAATLGTYTVTHPYGTEVFDVTTIPLGGTNVINFTVDIDRLVPLDFAGPVSAASPIDTFLTWDPPSSAPAGYVGNPISLHIVTGSPTGFNKFRIDGPNVGGPGVNAVETNLFNVMGRRAPFCGDGVVNVAGEQCDDGNTVSGDCCSPTCTFDPGQTVLGPDGLLHGLGTACSDGNACTANDACNGLGICLSGVVDTCNDNNPCTTDQCNATTGCSHDAAPNVGAGCTDFSLCTAPDTCTAIGTCVGTVISCDDSNDCTDDSCLAGSGCINAVNNTTVCDDGNACTFGDVCQGGLCTTSAPVDCNDNNPCTNDFCDGQGGCINANNALACEDGDPCTSGDVCSAGACLPGGPTNCDDGNVCTDDSCSIALGCQHADNSSSCSDGTACTEGDTCQGGACVGSTIAAGCGNGCLEVGEQCGEAGAAGCPVGQFCDACSCVVQNCAFVTLAAAGTLPGVGQTVGVDLLIDSGTVALGAYTVDISWNPSELFFDGVVAGSTAEFAGAPPPCNTGGVPGTATCTAFQFGSTTSPVGQSHVATLQFTVVDNSSATSAVTVTPQSVFAANGGTNLSVCNASDTENVAGKCGDLNASGVVTITDALLAAQFQVAIKTCGDIMYYERCDIAPPSAQDGRCSIGDALRMAQCSVGLSTCDFVCNSLPCPVPAP